MRECCFSLDMHVDRCVTVHLATPSLPRCRNPPQSSTDRYMALLTTAMTMLTTHDFAAGVWKTSVRSLHHPKATYTHIIQLIDPTRCLGCGRSVACSDSIPANQLVQVGVDVRWAGVLEVQVVCMLLHSSVRSCSRFSQVLFSSILLIALLK